MRRPRPDILAFTAAAATFLTPLLGRAQSPPAVAGSGADPAALADPNVDRGFMLPTALTQPKNTLTISDYEILLLGLTYGITDRLQLGAATFLAAGGPFFPDRMVLANLKWQFFRSGNLRLAALLGATYSRSDADHGSLPGGGGPHQTTSRLRPHTGLTGSYCVDSDCHSVLSANLIPAANPASSARGRGRSLEVVYSAGGTLRLSEHWKLLLEYSQSVTVSNLPAEITNPSLGVGARVFGRHLALDGGVMMLFGGSVLPLPFIAISARL
jgi:hypothetical protein